MNSILIASNVLKRLIKQIPIVVFLVAFPLIASVLGVLTSEAPSIISVGIVIDEDTLPIYNALNELKEYSVLKLSNNELKSSLDNNTIALAIKSSNDDYKFEIVSSYGGSNVDNLKNQLLYFNNNNEIYSIYKNGNNPPYSAIGIYLLFIMMFIGTSTTVVLDDRTKKTYMRLFCFSTSTRSIVLGYILAIFALGLLQVSFFIFLLKVIFKVNLIVGTFELFIILTTFLLATIGLAIGLASIITSKDKYNVVLPIFSLFSTFLSGSIIPVETMGKPFIYVSHFIPQSYVARGLKILANGGTFEQLAPNLGILILFTIVFFSFGTKLLDKEAL